MKKIHLLVMGLIILNSLSFSQIDPNQTKADKVYPMRMILPQSYSKEPYGIENMLAVTLQNGVFDFYQISANNGFAEPDIASAPWNPLVFVGTDNRITGYVGTPWIYYTTNGGVSWGNSSISGNQGDPVFAADSLGNFYLAVLNSGVQIYKSVNNGQSWSLASQVNFNGNTDKEWIACDPTNGPYKNNVYCAFVNFTSGGVVDFYRSVNNGSSWSVVQTNLGTGTPNPGPNIVVGNDGRVFVAWYNGGGTSMKISTDGGATLGATLSASAHSVPGAVNASGRYVLKGDIRCNGNPNLAVDRSTGPYRGTIYNCYSANPVGPDAADVFMTKSTDNGATWNVFTPIKINDDATFTDQWMSDVSVDRQGRIWAFWYDSRNDPTNNMLTECWAAVSTNGGASFSPNFRITSQFNPGAVKIFQGSNHYYMGDYQGISGESNITFPLTTGMQNNLQSYTAYLPDYGVGFNETIDSVNPGSSSTVRVRIPTFGPMYTQITYSATISPSPAPGTVTFTWQPSNVKTLNGTADSLTLVSSFSSNVPLNLYTVNVTGAENNGIRTHMRSFMIRVGNFVGVQKNNETAKEFRLEQNYPNPFNPETSINFSIPASSDVTLKIYDILGNLVQTVVEKKLESGNYTAKVDGTKLSSGIYFYRLETNSFTDVKRMMLIK